jgi:hypothetical protein
LIQFECLAGTGSHSHGFSTQRDRSRLAPSALSTRGA